MASSSSSRNPTWFLALKGNGGQWSYVPLYSARPDPGTLSIETSLHVSDREIYDIALAVDKPLSSAPSVVVSINGEESGTAITLRQPLRQDSRYLYLLDTSDKKKPQFALTFGFVTISLAIALGEDGALELSTREIPCSCLDAPKRNVVASMLSELSGTDEQPSLAWMLGSARDGAQASALRDGGAVSDRSRSIRAFISLAERSLVTLEKNLSLFRARPLSRTLPEERRVPAEKVRRVGRAETAWLSLNPEYLAEVKAERGIAVNGKHYVPTSLRTSLPKRSLDNMENRSTISFIAHIADMLDDAAEELATELNRMRGVRDALRKLEGSEGFLPSLVVADVCLELEEPLVGRIGALGKRAKKMLRLYRAALGDLPEGRYSLPRRSKAFQEIPHYAALWTSMKDWESFGTYPLSRETLLLSTYKMDKLYEYYALYGLLSWLQKAGFSPDQALGEEALKSVTYTLEDRFFKNETQVVNRYMLRRGTEKLTLYYQPVIYGDMRAEGGIDLHRTTAQRWLGTYRRDGYWTPDYLICVESGGRKRRYVLDAKFRSIGSAGTSYAGGQGDDDGLSEFKNCLAKYKYAILSEDGERIDGMWLLCGREQRARALKVNPSSWLKSKGLPAMNDGVVAFAPGVNALEGLFACLGVKGGRSKEASSTVGHMSQAEVTTAAPSSAWQTDKAGALSADAHEMGGPKEPTKPSAILSVNISERLSVEQSTPKREVTTSEEPAIEEGPRPQPAPSLFVGEQVTVALKKSKLEAKTRMLDPEEVDDVASVWRSLPEAVRKNCAKYSQRELGIDHPFIRLRKPTGREAKYYTSEPITIDGTPCYVFCNWKPMYRAGLQKAANWARKHAKS